jgi:dienelactone hydrolase
MKLHYTILIFFISLNNTLSQSHQEIIKFESANPFSLNDIIENLDSQEKQNVSGKLKLPFYNKKSNKKFPVVIGVAGSLGWADHHYEYLQMYREMGIATFELNSFESRNITSTVGTQNEVTIAAIILDAYKAFEILAKHPNIDKDRISITGWSLGGGVTLFSAWLPINNAINKKIKFKSHLAFYPPCFFEPENIEFSDSPIHILIGELDNWTPAEPCEKFVRKLDNNSNINLTIYEGSHHSFDKDAPVIRNENAYNFSSCLFKLTEDGDVLMNYLSIPMSNSFLQKIGFMFCVSRGVNYGGNPLARERSFAFAKKFMRETLLKN